MNEELKCVMGCKHYYGGEVKHHKYCPFYPDSLSRLFDEMEAKLSTPPPVEAYVPKECWVEVPVSEKPERMPQQDYLSINVVGVFNNGSITYPVWYDFKKEFWTYGKGELTTLTYWLRRQPLPLQTALVDVREAVKDLHKFYDMIANHIVGHKTAIRLFINAVMIIEENLKTKPTDVRDIASKAWDAGMNWGVDQVNVLNFIEGQIYPDKETYLNSLPTEPSPTNKINL